MVVVLNLQMRSYNTYLTIKRINFAIYRVCAVITSKCCTICIDSTRKSDRGATIKKP